MNETTIHTAGGHVYEHVAAGTFIGHDQLIVISGYTGADLEQVLTRLQAVLATGRATLCADVPRERLTVTAPDGTRLELSAAAGTALGEIAQQQADARAYLTALLVNPRYGRWATQFVPLAGTLTTLEHPPGWIEVPPEFSLLENIGAGPQRQIRRTHLDDITQALAQYPALVLLGEPGSGKTTTLYKLALEAAQQRLATGTGRLPLYLSLADYREPVAPYDFVESRLRQQVGAEAGELLRRGELLLLCDALNEMPFAHDREYREKVGAWRRFVSECPGHQILFSCRSRDYGEPLGLHQVEIERLDDARVQEFLEKYGVGATWERLRGTPLLALVRNPYYLQMLAYLVASRGTWPENRAALFQGFVAALLERERQRQPPDWPGAAALEAALAVLAEQLQPLGEGTRQPRSQALAWLPAEPEPAVVLRLGLAATLLDCERVPEGEEQVRFYHHQLQDYFAARALLTRFRAREDVTARWRQPRLVRELPDPGPLGDYEPLPPPPTTGWEEPTILAAGLAPDPAAFVAAVQAVNPVLAARCLVEAGLPLLPEARAAAQQALLRDLGDQRVHLRARIAAGEALGRLGDPRCQELVVHGTRVLLPPLVHLPGGTFPLGSSVWEVLGLALRRFPGAQAELPRHNVTVPEFYLGQYPVTNAEYACFVAAGGYDDPRWWPTAQARAWRRGESEGGLLQEWLTVWRAVQQNPALARRSDVTPWQRDAFLELAQMDEGQVRELVAGWQSERPRDRPALWDDARYNSPAQPVVGVTWYEAAAYCRWLEGQLQVAGSKLPVLSHGQWIALNLQPGTFNVQLPSEAEWEYAARGARGRRYAWGPRWDAGRANTWEGHVLRPTPVGVYPSGATPEGVYDLTGNVWEWTSSLYRPYPYRPADGREFWKAETFEGAVVVRGGSWFDDRRDARCAYRVRSLPGNGNDYIGLRVVLSLVGSGF